MTIVFIFNFLSFFLSKGPTGVGKTNIALCYARTYLGNDFPKSMLKFDLKTEYSDVPNKSKEPKDPKNKLIGDVKAKIETFQRNCNTLLSGNRHRIVILDKAEIAFKNDAIVELLDVMNSYSETIRFIVIICKNVSERMTIRNHDFEHIQLNVIAEKFITNKLVDICTKEKVSLWSKHGLKKISKAVFGDMRKALNILEHFINEKSFINCSNVITYLDESSIGPVIINNQQYEQFNVIFCKKKNVSVMANQ